MKITIYKNPWDVAKAVLKGKHLFKSFLHFSLKLSPAFIIICRNSLHILDKSKPFVNYTVYKYHFPVGTLLFTLLTVSLNTIS